MEQLSNAIAVFSLNDGQYSLNDIKQLYRQLASKHHPDKGGDTETMQLINNAFDEFCTYFAGNESLTVNNKDSAVGIDFEFIVQLKSLAGIIIEVCGYWVWLSGNTYLHREIISSLGFKFSGAKKMWYWFPTIDISTFKRGCKSMKIIRKQYGSKIIETENPKALN